VDPDIDWRAAQGAVDDVGEMHGLDAVRRYVEGVTQVGLGAVSTVRNGKVVRGREYLSVGDALEAAARREPPLPEQNG
jgi:hypothetical protein